MKNEELTKLDFKFHFYPWWKEPEYRLGSVPRIDEEQEKYFEHLED